MRLKEKLLRPFYYLQRLVLVTVAGLSSRRFNLSRANFSSTDKEACLETSGFVPDDHHPS